MRTRVVWGTIKEAKEQCKWAVEFYGVKGGVLCFESEEDYMKLLQKHLEVAKNLTDRKMKNEKN